MMQLYEVVSDLPTVNVITLWRDAWYEKHKCYRTDEIMQQSGEWIE